MRRLLVALSAHGFGHWAQTAPVLNALRERLPDLHLTVRSALPRPLLEARLHGAFTHQAASADFGMRMRSPMDVDVERSAAAYAELHAAWPQRLRQERAALAAASPDLELANVPYLSLAAAATLDLPALGMCSLNWADIYAHYCGARPEGPAIEAQIRAAYAGALAFLQPQPSMPMPDLACRRPVGPLATVGRHCKVAASGALGLKPGERWVLVNLGGVAGGLSLRQWPQLRGVRWVVPAAWAAEHPAALAQETLGLGFTDLLASCDALVTKPGYGIFAEAACNGIPVAYARRGDWPEEAYLVDWLRRHGRAREIGRADLEAGRLEETLDALWATPAPAPVAPTGIEEAADILLRLLRA